MSSSPSLQAASQPKLMHLLAYLYVRSNFADHAGVSIAVEVVILYLPSRASLAAHQHVPAMCLMHAKGSTSSTSRLYVHVCRSCRTQQRAQVT